MSIGSALSVVGCGYRIVGGQIVLSCSGGIQQVVRYEYVINDRETVAGESLWLCGLEQESSSAVVQQAQCSPPPSA